MLSTLHCTVHWIFHCQPFIALYTEYYTVHPSLNCTQTISLSICWCTAHCWYIACSFVHCTLNITLSTLHCIVHGILHSAPLTAVYTDFFLCPHFGVLYTEYSTVYFFMHCTGNLKLPTLHCTVHWLLCCPPFTALYTEYYTVHPSLHSTMKIPLSTC